MPSAANPRSRHGAHVHRVRMGLVLLHRREHGPDHGGVTGGSRRCEPDARLRRDGAVARSRRVAACGVRSRGDRRVDAGFSSGRVRVRRRPTRRADPGENAALRLRRAFPRDVSTLASHHRPRRGGFACWGRSSRARSHARPVRARASRPAVRDCAQTPSTTTPATGKATVTKTSTAKAGARGTGRRGARDGAGQHRDQAHRQGCAEDRGELPQARGREVLRRNLLPPRDPRAS